MFTEQQYISANKGACANNCIKNYLWHGKTFSDSLKQMESYELEYHYCSSVKMVNAIKDVLQTMTTEEGVKAFIREDKKRIISPCYKTVNDYIIGEYEIPGLTARKISEIVTAEMQNI